MKRPAIGFVREVVVVVSNRVYRFIRGIVRAKSSKYRSPDEWECVSQLGFTYHVGFLNGTFVHRECKRRFATSSTNYRQIILYFKVRIYTMIKGPDMHSTLLK